MALGKLLEPFTQYINNNNHIENSVLGNLTLQLIEELKSLMAKKNLTTNRRMNVENRDVVQDYNMDNFVTNDVKNRGIIHDSIPMMAKIAHFVTGLFDL